jgi:ABC-type glycerol-3-phosphate transport system permease component
MKRHTIENWVIYIFLIAFAIVVVFPYYWMITSAVRFKSDQFNLPPKLFTLKGTLENFVYVLTLTRVPQYLLNSAIISITATFVCLAASVPAGYALARFNFKGRQTVSSGILLIRLLPQTAALIPLYMLMIRLKMLDTHFGLSFLHLLPMIPYTIWMMRGYIKTVPISIEEAALIDGCNKLQMFVYILIPVVAAGVFAIGVYAFMISWEEFLFAYTFTSSRAKPISVGLALFMGEDVSLWGAIMAASVLMGFPMIFFFLLAQKHFLKGVMGGAIKG